MMLACNRFKTVQSSAFITRLWLMNGITYRKTLQTYHNAKKMNRLSFTLKNGMRIFKNTEIIIAWDSTKKHFAMMM